ncbi:RHS repeat domain-containing protein [Flavobacterium sp. HJJ]|uniref:RHS repeat domain-containing protein n=1 Tax=Flavobacterium sp. HJJ TaxID=2783792 RepID=UPI00188D6986|nr:RHS repeat-associated core domain-containing protein [Flavobacterium sp. HJJ]MBF4472943.1 VCBS repeat-containing protein [Flavobacterium sp. HJJ]
MKHFYFTLILLVNSLFISAQTPTGGSTEVGITEGQLSVSLTGSATYSIPIAVPPGINGVVPQVGLVYNSQGGNGLAGYGWNISGISAITRIPSTKFHDGTIDAVDFDALDRFAFNGQRLMIKSGTYGADGTIYETENFSNVKITSYGIHSSGANYGPAYFIVEYPDGSKAYYGNSTDSRTITNWSITYWENPQGVRINYAYNNSNNNLNIATIKYGTLGAITPINTVQFNYVAAKHPEQTYIGGLSITNNTILDNIAVTGNGIGFRSYSMMYGDTSLGYQRLTSITEISGDGTKSYNPTVFTYDTTADSIAGAASTTKLDLSNIGFSNAATVSGDFNGDGSMDFIIYPTIGTDAKKKFWVYAGVNSGSTIDFSYPYAGIFDDIFPVSYINYQNKLMPLQGFTVIQNGTFTTYALAGTGIVQQDQKIYTFPRFVLDYEYECGGIQAQEFQIATTQKIVDPGPTPIHYERDIPRTFYSGDFNGDGLTDIVAIEKSFTYPYQSGCVTYTSTYSGGRTFLINLDTRVTSNFATIAGNLATADSSIVKVNDFNGDGKSDIYVFDTGKVKIYGLDESQMFILLYETITADANIALDKPILMGDYNGDGKTDFIIPKGAGYSDLYKYSSTGIGFYNETLSNNINYPPNNSEYTYTLIPSDYNNDGKTDLILTSASRGTGYSVGSLSVTCYANKNGVFSNAAGNYYTGTISNHADIYPNALPVFLTSNEPNRKLELCFVNNNTVFKFNSVKDFSKEQLLRTIKTGNGVTESITYQPLSSKSKEGYSSIYSDSRFTENYPNMDLTELPSIQVVTKLEKTSNTTFKTQLFSYYGPVTNVEGLGFLGFRSLGRTNWFDISSNSISNISKYDISLRGANTENYSVLGTMMASGSTSPSNFITKSVLSYSSSLGNNKVFNIKNTSSKQFNGLDNTSSETTTVYDAYNNPTQSTTVVKNGSTVEQTSISDIVYENQTTGTYYIGRPTNKTQSVTVTGDVMTSEEKYVYTDHLLSQIKKRGNDPNDFITEDNIYDAFGNITKKTITVPTIAPNPAPAPRVTNYEYDISGRFLTKSTDIEGLATTFAYNTSSGVLNSETNPYGLTTAYLYDSWFKKTKTTDYLGKSNTYVYSRTNSVYTLVSTAGDDGSSSEETFDDLGRKIKSGAKNVQGVFSYITYLYDFYDRNNRTSEPYLGNSSPSQWNETKYDIYGRPIQNISYTGKTVNITYTGLTTVADEGTKSKSSIKNAIGNVISITDNPGGTITYTYFANGNLKSSTFNNTTTIITQDGWGRKLTLSDPSAGLYQYSYNGFGELLTETAPNPKGVTTYTLNDVGKLTQKTIVGDAVNSRTTYLYDPSSKLLTTSTFEDLNEGTSSIVNAYEYDSSKRIIKSMETTPFAIFTKTLTYDAFGRVDKETSKAEAKIGGKSSSKTMMNTYSYGQLYMLIDDTSHRPKLQTNTVNARGQLLNGFIYNNAGYINVTNTYDTYGLLSQTKHDNSTTSTNMMILNTVFDAQKGNLTSRTNSFFGTNQSFEYDEQDRLTKWTDSPELILNNTFDTSADGFTADSGVTPMPNFSNSGMLGVKVTTANLGISKKIVSGASIGDTFRIQLLMTSGDKISVILREQDASGTNFIDTVLSLVSGPIDQDYKVKTYSELVIKIIKTDASVYAGTPTFLINNLIVQKYNVKTQQYDAAGKITQNELGTYAYNVAGKPYQNSSINPTPATATYYQTKPLQTITYNTFKSPVSITEQGVDIINFTYNDTNKRSTMFYGGLGPKESRRYRKYYSSDGTMEIKQDLFNNNAVEIITYIGGDGYTAPMIVKSDGTTQNYLYLHRDYQGSIAAISNDGGAIVEKRLFDPWGAIIKIQDGTGNALSGLTVLDRGYTGHEHLQSVGLINMNARLYDPKLHRFLQPDNFVQEPFNTQNYNRYGYCINNPLKYTDKNGEFFLGTIITAITNGVQNVIKHGVNTDQYNWKELNNAWKIDIGQFKGNFGQMVNRFTWGSVNNDIGNLLAHGYNLAGQVEGVTYLAGATAIETKRSSTEAFTIGSYINGPKGFKADWHDHLFVHEYGHTIQQSYFGPLYMPIVATSSLASTFGIGGDDHKTRWFEVQASHMGAKYFDKRYGSGVDGYTKGSADYFDYESFSNGGLSPYANPRNTYYPNLSPKYQFPHPTSGGRFSWWDVGVPLLTPLALSLIPHL